MRSLRGWPLLLTLVVVGVSRGADRGATLSGLVKLPDGKPAANAAVLVDGFINLQAVTGKDGKYQIRNVPWGLHTVVAILRTYKRAQRMNLEVRRGARMTVDFTLEKDPDYVPDAIRLDELSPPPDAIVPPGQEVEFSGVLRYRLRNFPNAKVVLNFEDDRGNPLMLAQMRFDIKQGSAAYNFRRRVQTPARFGPAEMFLSAAIVPLDRGPLEATHVVGYQVRTFADDMKFGALAFSAEEPGRVRFTAAVDYELKTVEQGTIRCRVLGDEGKSDFAAVLHEAVNPVAKAMAASGTLKFSGDLNLPGKVRALRVRLDLIPQGAPDPKLVKNSKIFPPPAVPGKP